MRFAGLRARPEEPLPGTVGVARVDRRTGDLLRRIGPGDIAVLDRLDLDRRTAEALVAAEVAGVVNAAPSISGRFPNLGPEVLVAAGIPLVDGVGAEALRRIREGSTIRLHDGAVYQGQREIARGTEQTAELIAAQLVEAKAGMAALLEAFSANTVEFLRRERALILDGVGVPGLRTPLRGRQVLVVAAGPHVAEELRALRGYLREHRPVLVGVDRGAEILHAAGHKPGLIVGDPDGVPTEILRAAARRGAEVVVPAQPDGHAPGLERVQDLGVAAVTFPASGSAEDLALLLAEAHGASLVVTLGLRAGLREFLDRDRLGENPSAFLTRLKLGALLVDGSAVATLHRPRVSAGATLLLVAACAAAIAVALIVSGAGPVYAAELAGAWRALLAWTKGWLS
ncbi:putative cytokinetic ring protein SteA [Gandjariella thermophila]|uniref:Thiamin pyrophosphokinase n=1 Tax=Gandjariella thermophila TaxID=1931992 RepID=A0A4D4JF11_9PSEU|nr:putative cytokinetic ring protein SteA [Gandjariella thermophila]GDY33610.1 thiamin pyrophosphokinase [Gandjariella thermophila]